MCAECEEGFGVYNGYSCSDCHSFEIYLKQVLIIIIRVILFIVELRNIFEYGDDMVMIKKAKTSYLLKILKDHIQVLSLMMIIPIGISSDFITFFSVITTPTSPDLEKTFSLRLFYKNYRYPNKTYPF